MPDRTVVLEITAHYESVHIIDADDELQRETAIANFVESVLEKRPQSKIISESDEAYALKDLSKVAKRHRITEDHGWNVSLAMRDVEAEWALFLLKRDELVRSYTIGVSTAQVLKKLNKEVWKR